MASNVNLAETSETLPAPLVITTKLSNEGKSAALVVSPAIRRQFSLIVRQHVEDMIVLAFTELPDNRKINVVASITG